MAEPDVPQYPVPVNALSAWVGLGLALAVAVGRLAAAVRRRREIRRLRSWYELQSAPSELPAHQSSARTRRGGP